MYNVLIAEDEKLVRIGLKHSIKWEKYNMAIIGDVDNGLDAYEFYKREHPDLIIVDIKMPVMDGIELISKIREKDRQTKIIVLSCLDEFDVARMVINLGTSGYILKLTMTNEEMDHILNQVFNELEQNSKVKPENYINNFSNKNWKRKEEIIYQFINGNLYSEADFTNYISELEMNIDPACMLVCLGQYEKNNSWTEKDDQVITDNELGVNTMMDVVHQNVGETYKSEVIANNKRSFIIIISFGSGTSESAIYLKISELLVRICTSIRRYFNFSIYFGISDIQRGLSNLRPMLLQAKIAVELKFFDLHASHLFYRDIDKDKIRRNIIEQLSCSFKDGLPNNPEFEKNYKDKVMELVGNVTECMENCSRRFLEELCYLLQWSVNSTKCWDEKSARLVTDISGKMLTDCSFKSSIEYLNMFFDQISKCYIPTKILAGMCRRHSKLLMKIIIRSCRFVILQMIFI